MGYENTIYYELEKQFKDKSKKRYDHLLLWVIIILLIPFLCFLFVKKPHTYVSDINNLPEPVQVPAGGRAVKHINGETVYIEFLAQYEVQGRVLAKKSYAELFADNAVVNKMGPRDFVLGRGVMGREENMDKFNWGEYGNRVVYGVIKHEYYDWFTETFSGNRESDPILFRTSFSNNHPIWSTQKIRLLMQKIKVGDVIKMEGYLVYVHPQYGNWWWGPSSMVRDDHGCEIIYVTNLSRLREK